MTSPDGESNDIQRNGPTDDLNPTQLVALEALLTGASVTDAAEQAGVDRTTVSRWKNQDPDFMAALNAGTAELRDEMERRMDHLTRAAIETVAEAIENGDVVTSRQYLRGRGLLDRNPRPVGPADPNRLRLEQLFEQYLAEEAAAELVRALEHGEVGGRSPLVVVTEILIRELAAQEDGRDDLRRLRAIADDAAGTRRAGDPVPDARRLGGGRGEETP